MLGFFHSGAGHVTTFEHLAHTERPSITTRHVVRQDLLASAVAAGRVTDDIVCAVQAEVRALVAQGARVVVCTCSTLGDAAEATRDAPATIMRVDRPLAERLVASGEPILVVAALPSAMTTAVNLLRSVGRDRSTAVRLRELPCHDAWPLFLSGDQTGYVEHVAERVERDARTGEHVMLAQASMAPALSLIVRSDIQVFTSPQLGVSAALAAYGT